MIKVLLALAALFIVACSSSEAPETGNPEGYAQDTSAPMPVRDPALRPAAATAAPTNAVPQGAIRVQKAKIVDSNGFEQPMTAATILTPAGWQAQGGIAWQQNMAGCGKKTPHFAWRAASPDGLSVMQLLPEETWSGNNMQAAGISQQGCPNVWLQSAKDYIHTWVQHNRADAKVLDYRDRRDFVAELEKQLQQQPAMPGYEIRQWAEGGQALIAYTQQGMEVREIIGISILFTLMRMQGVMPGEVQETLSLVSFPGFAMRAPAGKLDLKLAEMLRKSGRPNPQWLARIAQHNNKIAQINAKGARDRSRLIAQTGEEIRAMQRDSWNKYNASQDYLHREATETIRGTETYNDPYHGGTVELDNTYEHAWQLNDGTYILTDDSSFNPYAATGQDGQQLEVTP